MESFTIQCTSCQSRIRVRNPNMIGQIANCPKCGSMIMISAPQKILVESGNPTDSVAVTRESIPAPDSSLLNSPSTTETGFRSDGLPPSQRDELSRSSAADEGRESFDSPFGDDLPAADDDGYQLAQADDDLLLNAWMPEPTPPSLPEPRQDDVSSSIETVRNKRLEAAAKKRQILMIVGIGMCSLLLAVGMLTLFLRMFAGGTKPTELGVGVGAGPNEPAGEMPGVAAGGTSNPLLNEVPLVGGADPNTVPTTSDNSDNANNPTAPTAPTNAAMSPASNGDASKPPVDSVANGAAGTSTPSTVGNSTSTKAPLGGTIAPSLDSVLSPAGPNDPANAGSDAEKAKAVSESLPPGLQSFAQLFTAGLEPTMADAAVPLSKAPDVAEDPNAKAAKSGPTLDDLVPPTAATKLNHALAGLLINKRPLSEALTTLALVSDVPMVADIDSLLAGGLGKNPLVEFRATEPVTITKVLEAIQQSTKISLLPWENRVIYARASNAELESRVPVALPIGDLVTSAEQTAALLQAIKEVLPELGDSIQAADGQLQLALTDENRLTWFQAARLLETWRSLRGIENSITKELVPKASQLPAWPVAAMQSAAQSPVRGHYTPEPLARSWQRLAADAKLACWVDWYALSAAEVSPSQKSLTLPAGRTLLAMLQYYADKYQIVFAIEDTNTLWVTTRDMHRLQPRLYVLPLNEKNLEEWTAELEPLAPVHPTSGQSMLKLIPSPDGQYLFVRACRPILAEAN